MRKRWQVVALVVFAVLIGAGAGAWLTASRWQRQFEEWRRLEYQGEIVLATEIYRQNGQRVADRIREATPTLLASFDPQDPDHVEIFWAARDMYSSMGGAPPAELARIFAELPPKPQGCCIPQPPVSKKEG